VRCPRRFGSLPSAHRWSLENLRQRPFFRMARIVTVYRMWHRYRPFEMTDMSHIRWVKISAALASLGHQVDIATVEPRWLVRRAPLVMAPNLRRVPLTRVRWNDYDVVKDTLWQRLRNTGALWRRRASVHHLQARFRGRPARHGGHLFLRQAARAGIRGAGAHPAAQPVRYRAKRARPAVVASVLRVRRQTAAGAGGSRP
jgi:hypothetical protein